jgi:hypothetical protein
METIMDIRRLTWLVIGAVPLLAVGAASAGQFLQQPANLVDVVRRATDRFRNPEQALADGYTQMPSCVSGPEEGAMGVHFVDVTLVGDGELDAERPEALVYEARNGRLRLVAVEYIVPAPLWDAHHEAPPVLMGQQFLYVGSPNRYGGPAFYELHVWAWRQNPNGMFVDWNPRVSCEEFPDAPAHSSSH